MSLRAQYPTALIQSFCRVSAFDIALSRKIKTELRGSLALILLAEIKPQGRGVRRPPRRAERKPFPAASPACGLEIQVPFLTAAAAAAPASGGTGAAPALPRFPQHRQCLVAPGPPLYLLPPAPAHPRVTPQAGTPLKPSGFQAGAKNHPTLLPTFSNLAGRCAANPSAAPRRAEAGRSRRGGDAGSQLSVTPERPGQLYLYVQINIHKAELKRQSQLLCGALQLLLPADPPRHARSL